MLQTNPSNRPSFLRRQFIGGVLAVAATSLSTVNVQAADGANPKQVIQTLVDDAFKVMQDETLKKDRKNRIAQLRTVVDKVVDWGDMAKSSLGKNWRNINEAQRTEFVNIFKDLLARQYMDDVDRFQGTEKVTVKEAESHGQLQVVKTTLLTASKELIPIDYTLHQTPTGFRVTDFSVEGVSMVNHFRKTFDSFLVNKNINDLIKQLRTKLGSA